MDELVPQRVRLHAGRDDDGFLAADMTTRALTPEADEPHLLSHYASTGTSGNEPVVPGHLWTAESISPDFRRCRVLPLHFSLETR